jgi:hypothetical protein
MSTEFSKILFSSGYEPFSLKITNSRSPTVKKLDNFKKISLTGWAGFLGFYFFSI